MTFPDAHSPGATGICWCVVTPSDSMQALLACVREGERARQVSAADGDALVRHVIAEGVDAALSLASDSTLGTGEFLKRCYALRGQPWDQARARRDMRERVRLWRALDAGDPAVPCTPDDLLRLWAVATQGEVSLYREAATPQFRVEGVPFAHTGIPFEPAPVAPERETVAASDIPLEVGRLLAFMQREAIPLEVKAAVAKFAVAYIHPFRDGNGHTGRLLMCLMLAQDYAPTTLLCFDSVLQNNRHAVSQCIRNTVLHRADLGDFVCLVLGMLREAQEKRDAFLSS